MISGFEISPLRLLNAIQKHLEAHVLSVDYLKEYAIESKRILDFNKSLGTLQLWMKSPEGNELELIGSIFVQDVPQEANLYAFRAEINKAEELLLLIEDEEQLERETLRTALTYEYIMRMSLKEKVENIPEIEESKEEYCKGIKAKVNELLPLKAGGASEDKPAEAAAAES